MLSKGRFLILLIVLVMAPVAARADQKDDLFNKAQSLAASNPVESAKLYCQVADMDATYKNAKMMCSIMKKEADKELQKNEDRFKAATDDFNQKKWDDAVQKFKNVRAGSPRYDEAQQYLNARIPSARKAEQDEIAATGKRDQEKRQLDDGTRAYEANDFEGAKAKLAGLSDPKAQDLLNKIKQYQQAMAQGDQLFGARNYRAAKDAYVEAARYKSNGPGDPNGKAARASQLMADSDCAAQKPTFAGFQVSPSNGQAALNVKANVTARAGCKPITVTQIQWGDGSQSDGNSGSHVFKNAGTYDVVAWVTDEAGNKVSTTQTVRVIEAAVKQVTPEVDIAKTLAEARTAKKKGDIAGARGKYMKVLSADKGNTEALSALDELSKMAATTTEKPAPETPQTPGVISESDTLLAKGISEYYTGNFDDAYSDLKSYLQFKGEKMGLANFYLGALKATQYHLGGGTEQKALDAANNFFKAAKKSPKFKVPDKYISPKIVSMYNSSGM